jgi:hypothetical protein
MPVGKVWQLATFQDDTPTKCELNIFELSRLPGCLLETQGGKPIGGE